MKTSAKAINGRLPVTPRPGRMSPEKLGPLLFFGFTLQLLAGCPGSAIQALVGSGANTKVGFECGTGCQKKYYLVSAASTWDKCTVDSKTRQDTGCGTFENGGHFESESVSGYDLNFQLQFDSDTCTTTTTLNGTANSVSRLSYQNVNHTSVCRGIISRTSCNSFSVDGVLVSDPDKACAPVSCDATGYTLVSSTNVTDPCEGTKTVEVWTYQNDDTRSVLKREYSSSPGFKMEYTTGMAIQRAKLCANAQLDQQSFTHPTTAFGNAVGSMSLAADLSSANYQLSRWRLAVTGTSAEERYEVQLRWRERVNGRVDEYTEKRVTSGSDQPLWYYPSEEGELLAPKESSDCNYSSSKELIGASIEEVDEQ